MSSTRSEKPVRLYFFLTVQAISRLRNSLRRRKGFSSALEREFGLSYARFCGGARLESIRIGSQAVRRAGLPPSSNQQSSSKDRRLEEGGSPARIKLRFFRLRFVILSAARDERSRKIAPSLVVKFSSVAKYTLKKHTARDGVGLTTSEGAIFRLRSSLATLKMTKRKRKNLNLMRADAAIGRPLRWSATA